MTMIHLKSYDYDTKWVKIIQLKVGQNPTTMIRYVT